MIIDWEGSKFMRALVRGSIGFELSVSCGSFVSRILSFEVLLAELCISSPITSRNGAFSESLD